MKKSLTAWITLPIVALLGLAAACADVPTAAPVAGPSFERRAEDDGSQPRGKKHTNQKQTNRNDTITTVITMGTDTSWEASVPIGFDSRLDFPYQIGSICDPLLSSYGRGTWDSDCTPLSRSITITAKTWLNADRQLEVDFQPALRFVPRLPKSVLLTLKTSKHKGARIDFCDVSGCIDESREDPSLRTWQDRPNKAVYRIIKHFSGYTVVAD